MALVRSPDGSNDFSGSIGGQTYARNRGGLYVRRKVGAVNANTALQQTVRAILGSLAGAWQALTEEVRTAWTLYADNTPVINRVGTPITLSGFNHFVRSNSARLSAGFAIVTAAPVTFGLPDPIPSLAVASTGIDSSDQEFDVEWTGAPAALAEVGGGIVLFQGRPVNPSIGSFTGPYRFCGTIEGAAVAPASPQTAETSYVTGLGQKCWLQYRVIRADGRVSNLFRIGPADVVA